MIAFAGNPNVAELLKSHPRFREVNEQPGLMGCRFGEEGHFREIEIGNPEADQYGLVELIDNNPLICADRMSLPSLAVSAALVCLGPLVLSSIIQEQPVLIINAPVDEAELSSALSRLGWADGILIKVEDFPTPSVVVASASAAIPTPSDPEDLADMYEERFARSLLIDGDVAKEWEPGLVRNRAACAYRISLTGDQVSSLVTVRSMVDASGRYQAAQVVNALNIMCGFEDSLGLHGSQRNCLL